MQFGTNGAWMAGKQLKSGHAKTEQIQREGSVSIVSMATGSIGKLGYFPCKKSTYHRNTAIYVCPRVEHKQSNSLGSARNTQQTQTHIRTLWRVFLFRNLDRQPHTHIVMLLFMLLCYCSYLRRMKAAEEKKKAAADE